MANLRYNPTSVSPPGATLCDLLEERGISQKVLSLRLGRSDKNLSQIVNGKAPITPELAVNLEQVLGTPARFWLERESRYQEWLVRSNAMEPTNDDRDWARSFNYAKMAEYGWVPPAAGPREKYSNLLHFFAVVNRSAFCAWAASLSPQFRRSAARTDKDHLIAAWLRQGEIKAEEVAAGEFDEKSFGGAVNFARTLTCKPPGEFIPALTEAFTRCGVVVLFVPELPGMGVSGATRWLTPSKALIQITLHYETNDILWFTIFHEACHILRHQKRAMYLETIGTKSLEEIEADTFAANLLIPPHLYHKFTARNDLEREAIDEFASSLGIAPAIVIRRLQNDGLLSNDSPLNGLKLRYMWSDEQTAGTVADLVQ